MANRFREALRTSCQILMRPIARYLISSGMRYAEFLEISKAEFIKAACDLGSPEDTTSSISERIGANRKDVSRYRKAAEIDVSSLAYQAGIPAMIVSRWHQDPDFVDNDGAPRRISLSEFKDLVFRVDSSLVSEDLLTELLESGSVRRGQDGSLEALRRYFIPRGGDTLQVLRFGMRVRDLADTMYRNSINDRPGIEASVYNSHVTTTDLPLLRRVARTQIYGLLQSLDDWLTAHSGPDSEDVVRAGVGVYFFEDNNMKDYAPAEKGAENSEDDNNRQ